MNSKTIDQLKRATANVKREQFPVAKGDIVAVIITHRRAVSMYGRKVLTVSADDYESCHLGRVTKATRQGRAVKVQLIAHPGAPIDAHDRLTRTLSITAAPGVQQAAVKLAATMDHAGANEFASTEHLKTALLALKEDA